MWTEPLQNGKYKAVERYTDPITGKVKKISITIEKDTRNARKEAQKRLDEKIEAILGKTDYDNMTLRELCDRYLETIKKQSSRNTLTRVCNRVCRVFGDNIRVNAMTALYVSDKIKGYETIQYNNILHDFKGVIRFGYSQDFVKDKAWIDKLKPRKDDRKSRIENKYLEPEELTKLIDSMDKCQHWQLLTKFLALSGLRVGEALALTPDDVDTYIHVTKTYLIRENVVSDTPKTADSNRDVFVQPELAEVISEIRKWRLPWMMKKGIRSDRLFPFTYTSYRNFLALRNDLIPGKTLSPHTLRHTHASLLAAAGMSLEAISRRLGHSDSDITKQVYLHVTEKLRKQEEEQMSKIKIL